MQLNFSLICQVASITLFVMPAQGQSINQDTFTDCCLEWRYKEVDMRLRLQGIDDLECAACYSAPHTLHIDANMKLYVWDWQRQAGPPTMPAFYFRLQRNVNSICATLTQPSDLQR